MRIQAGVENEGEPHLIVRLYLAYGERQWGVSLFSAWYVGRAGDKGGWDLGFVRIEW